MCTVIASSNGPEPSLDKKSTAVNMANQHWEQEYIAYHRQMFAEAEYDAWLLQ